MVDNFIFSVFTLLFFWFILCYHGNEGGLSVTDGIIRYNAACKRILSEKVILAHLLKVCVVEYEGCDISEVVQSISDDGYREGRVIGRDSVNLEVGYSKIE